MTILRYIGGRALGVVPTLLGITFFTTILVDLLPGNLITVMIGLNLGGGPAEIKQLRQTLHLNESIPQQFASWLAAAAHGDLGRSLVSGLSVSSQIATHAPVTLELTLYAVVLAVLIGIPLGIVAAGERNIPVISAIPRVVAIAGLAVPDFVLGTIVIIVGAIVLPGVATFGYVPFLSNPLLSLERMFFPALTLGLALSTIVLRYTRSSVRDVLREPYVLMAKAKGADPWRTMLLHVLPNALLPVVTIVGVNGAYLLGGAVIVEQVFALPGVGQLLLNSIEQHDLPTVQGTVLVVTVVVVLVNLTTEVCQFALDPRLRGAA